MLNHGIQSLQHTTQCVSRNEDELCTLLHASISSKEMVVN